MSRYIDADAIISFVDAGHLRNPLELAWSDNDVVDMIESRPTVDAVQVVRCGECKWAEVDAWWTYCKLGHKEDTTNSIIYTCTHDFYCADGERRTDEQQT